jgi:hypothetical protein
LKSFGALVVLLVTSVSAAPPETERFSLIVPDTKLPAAFAQLSVVFGQSIAVASSGWDDYRVSGRLNGVTVLGAVNELLRGVDFYAVRGNDNKLLVYFLGGVPPVAAREVADGGRVGTRRPKLWAELLDLNQYPPVSDADEFELSAAVEQHPDTMEVVGPPPLEIMFGEAPWAGGVLPIGPAMAPNEDGPSDLNLNPPPADDPRGTY